MNLMPRKRSRMSRMAWSLFRHPLRTREFPAKNERLITADELLRFGIRGSRVRAAGIETARHGVCLGKLSSCQTIQHGANQLTPSRGSALPMAPAPRDRTAEVGR
jgi:hypothetical protein